MNSSRNDDADPRPNSVLVVVDFGSAVEVGAWSAIDDVVMGGVSSSALVASDEGTALFTGAVSMDKGGGFASVRSPDRARALAGRQGLRVHSRGDGQRYKLRVRTSADFEGIAYQIPFVTQHLAWSTTELAFVDFVPVLRGRVVPGAAPLDPGAIVSFGFLISDRQAGRFRLDLARIEAF
ncbi:MAG: CIA30 family protein [Planctomycetes bacterium]|nr:CIA30 family protein [Planctomycetota bacterium]